MDSSSGRIARERADLHRSFGSLFISAGLLGIGFIAISPVDAAQAPDDWRMLQRDSAHTGRADYTVPQLRLNDHFFDLFLWQTRSPDSPNDGGLGGAQMVFCEDCGPGDRDLVLGTYHWPKGVIGIDRHSGEVIWFGNPEGGESIAESTPAFRSDSERVYLLNDATEDGEFPNGHPLMVIDPAIGPTSFYHNGSWSDPGSVGVPSLTVSDDDWILGHGWGSAPACGWENNIETMPIWTTQSTNCEIGRSNPVFAPYNGDRIIVAGTRGVEVIAWDAWGNEVWRVGMPGVVDAPVTADPLNGNLYVPCGEDDIWIAGIGADGAPLWNDYAVRHHMTYGGAFPAERAQGGGCLSHDGSTFYFQTIGAERNGRLYAIDTGNGLLRWTLETGSWSSSEVVSSPIVTPNGVLVVGNNDGGTYFAILDHSDYPEVLDTLRVAPGGNARASASLALDGTLYLPLRTVWTATNGSGELPSYDVQNLFTGIDLREEAIAQLFPPGMQRAYVGNGSVEVIWRPVVDPAGAFSHYAIYRDTQPFTSVEGKIPLAEVTDVASDRYLDPTAANGVSYHYAVTTVALGGAETKEVASIGPRTPRDETDLQVISVARTPRYPRYAATYSEYTITEPGGYGPYLMSAATGLGEGQDENTQRFPAEGQSITYTATVRNRGTNPWSGSLAGEWKIDGTTLSTPIHAVSLPAGALHTFSISFPWTAQRHTLRFGIHPADARPGNDAYELDTRSIAYLSYVDRTRLEEFREQSAAHPAAQTDDFLDFVSNHVRRMNQLFEQAGAEKRIHYDVLEVLEDTAPDPQVQGIDFAIFPFRWRAGEGDLRLAGYYDPADDLDWGLLHEWGHQLGLIDIYQLNLEPWQNEVNGTAYRATECLMHGCSHVLSEHSRNGMNWWQEVAHGYFGQYIYCLPDTLRLRVIGIDGGWLPDATVRVYQAAERPGIGKTLSPQVKFTGKTDGLGLFTFPNVPIDPELVPETFAGDRLKPNPFGYLAVVANNGLFLLEVEYQGNTDFAWLDVTEVNNAYWNGETSVAIIPRTFRLGGELEVISSADMTEWNAASWEGWADGSDCQLSDDADRRHDGGASLRMETGGGFDTYVRYPGDHFARWNLTEVQTFRGWYYAENDQSFQDANPRIVILAPGGSVELRPSGDLLTSAIGQWTEIVTPLAGSEDWERIVTGTPDLSRASAVEIHADTWGYGFTLWLDGLRFDPLPTVAVEPAPLTELTFAGPHPNPTSGPVRLRFGLPRPESVRLEVFDGAGRRVFEQALGLLSAGPQEWRWDGKDARGRALPSGVYLARLSSASHRADRKVVLTR
jgi:hypothetical protein